MLLVSDQNGLWSSEACVNEEVCTASVEQAYPTKTEVLAVIPEECF